MDQCRRLKGLAGRIRKLRGREPPQFVINEGQQLGSGLRVAFFYRSQRYSSFDNGKGKEFSQGKLTLEDLRAFAIENGEPEVRSGRQEYLENIINRFI